MLRWAPLSQQMQNITTRQQKRCVADGISNSSSKNLRVTLNSADKEAKQLETRAFSALSPSQPAASQRPPKLEQCICIYSTMYAHKMYHLY